jgi:hypothetical protein
MKKQTDDFYEVLPYAKGQPYQDNAEPEMTEADARRTAIITLVIVLVTMVILALLALRGLHMLRDASML